MKRSRRDFIKTSIAGSVVAGFPAIVPSSVFGATAPSNRIHIGAIGVERISRGHDMPGVIQFTGVAGRDNRIIAVCDLSRNRLESGKQFVDNAYAKKLGKPDFGHRACTTCLLHWIAMKTNHHIHWDPATETLLGDDIAASLLPRHQRSPYQLV